jgi:hypothetical protein
MYCQMPQPHNKGSGLQTPIVRQALEHYAVQHLHMSGMAHPDLHISVEV